MKVLWFANTPANGVEVLQGFGVRGGWLSALDRALHGKVELTVVFYYARYAEPFNNRGVMYIPICKKNWKINIIKENLFGSQKDRDDLSIYVDIVNKIKPEIIHIHGTENPFCCIIEETDLPVVLSIQGNFVVYTYKYFSGIEKNYLFPTERSIFNPYSWIFNKSYKQLYRRLFIPSTKRELKYFGKFRYIIGRTDWDKRITRVLSPGSIYFHNDEILRDSFYKMEWRRPTNKTIILHSTIGDALFKGLETICQSLNELSDIGMDVEWRVAGVSKECLLVRLVKRKLKTKYPKKGLVLLGDLNEQKLVEKMLEADIYIMPSHIENSPNSLCEAMILGMPCITTLAGGSSSLLKDKEEGLVIQDGDPWSMAGAIIELLKNPEIAVAYGRNARNRAMCRHNPNKIVDDLMAIYQQISG